MRLLVSSIVDLCKAAPNRLHHLLSHLSVKHEIDALCVNDWKRQDALNTSVYDGAFSSTVSGVSIRYGVNSPFSPTQQELLYPLLCDIGKGDYDLILNYSTLVSGYYLSKRLDLPMIYDLADDLPEMIGSHPDIPRPLRPIGKELGRFLMKRNIKHSQKVTCITPAIRDMYSISPEVYELLPNGVDTNLFNLKKERIRDVYGLGDHFVLGYVGVLREWVDFVPVFKALSRIKDALLLIVGREGKFHETQRRAKEMGVGDKVIFTGSIPYHKVPSFISSMDACLIPFRQTAIANMSFPLKLLEYMACEKPVISSDLKGVREAAGDLVMYVERFEDYVFAVRQLMRSNNSDDLGKAGRDFVVRNYDWGAISQRLGTILEEAV